MCWSDDFIKTDRAWRSHPSHFGDPTSHKVKKLGDGLSLGFTTLYYILYIMQNIDIYILQLGNASCSDFPAGRKLGPWDPGTLGPWDPGTLGPWDPGTLGPWDPWPERHVGRASWAPCQVCRCPGNVKIGATLQQNLETAHGEAVAYAKIDPLMSSPNDVFYTNIPMFLP